MVHRLSDLLGHQSTTKDKTHKQLDRQPDKQTDKPTDKQTDKLQVKIKPPDLAIIQDSNIADSGVNMTDADINTVTPLSSTSFSYESCESPYGTYSYNSTPFSTESLVNAKE